MSKKRIMLVTESAINNSGYSVMSRELLSRLHKTGKYEIMELGIYSRPEDDRLNYFPWKIYPVMPEQGDAEGWAQYNARIEGQSGAWCFEKACLEFKPDVVMCFDDPYRCCYQLLSPLRPYFRHLYMPTVDATPQTDDWANQYIMSDGILSYSEFGKRVLKKTCGNSINFINVASPGASFDDMVPLDKKEIRRKYGISEDILLIGMVARNQIRKGFPDLFEAFRKFIDIAPKELSDKAFLHVHTGHPDAGWDMPRLLKEYGLSHKVYFTYVCRSCADIRISLWNDYGLICRRCGSKQVFLTQPSFGLNRKNLCELYNLYDLYVQYAFLEGFGVPAVEAAACGVPLAVVPYSAMEDFVDKLNAYPVPIAKLNTEVQSHRKWAFPDNSEFAKRLVDILQSDLKTLGEETHELCKKHFDWDKSAKIWEDAIDSLPEPERKWDDPKRDFLELPVDNSLDDSSFVKECFKNISFSEHLCKGFLYNIFIKNLYNGNIPNSTQNGLQQSFSRENVINECKAMQAAVMHWEGLRCQSST